MNSTSYKLATSIIQNGQGISGWLNPTNIFLVDGDYAVSGGPSNILTIGNFNLNIPQGSDITNFSVQVKGYRGSYNTTLQIYAVDDTTGVALSYPMAPFQSFSGSNTLFTLPNTLFGTTWTVDQANNIKFTLVADGELHLDAFLVSADYVPTVSPQPVPPSSGQVVVDEFVQAQPFSLAESMTDSDLVMFLDSFNYPNGEPIEYADFWGEADLVIDQGVPGKEESVMITNVEQNYQSTGKVRLSFGSITNRGLKFEYPYDHDITLCKAHDSTAKCVISNSARFYSRFLKKNQINALVSAPIIVQDESVSLSDPAHTLDFRGAGVSVVNDGSDTFKKVITIPGNGVNPPFVSSTSSATSGGAQVTSLTWSHVSSGINRLLLVEVTTETAQTISGITFNGVALTQKKTNTNGTVRNEIWALTAPAVGTYNIVISLSGPAYVTAGAETLNSVNQTTPIGASQTATGTSLTPSLVLTTTVDNSLVVDSLGTGTLPIVYTVGVGQVENWKITANPSARQGASSIEFAGTQPDAVTMSWAITQSIPWVLNAVEVIGIGTGGFVQTVTDNGTGVVSVDNTDPQNPIVDFNGVNTDGTTITGDGTPGNPLVATAGAGASVVKATSADTTPSYLDNKITLINGTNTTVTKTILNPGANEKIQYQINATSSGSSGTVLVPGQEIYIGGTTTGADFGAKPLISFDKWMVNKSALIGWSRNSLGGYITKTLSLQSVPTSATVVSTGITKNEDETKLYITRIAWNGTGSASYILVDEFDTTLTSSATYSRTTANLTITANSDFALVKGTKVVVGWTETQSYSLGNPAYCTEYEFSGSTLINPVVTNIYIATWGGGGSATKYLFGFSRNDGFVYVQKNNTSTPWLAPEKCTYSAATLTNVATTTSAFPSSNFSITNIGTTNIGGFEIPLGTSNVGFFTKTSLYFNTGSNYINKFIYQLYSF